MCGINGIIKLSSDNSLIKKLIIKSLNILKNRGYDSCGVFLSKDNLNHISKLAVDGDIRKSYGNMDIFKILENKLDSDNSITDWNIGIGHTRWATHGEKTDENSHPHMSNSSNIILVHNGIISNYTEIKEKYLNSYNFYSSTDTEIIANLIEKLELDSNTDDIENFNSILEKVSNILVGTWACIIYNKKYPNTIFWMKNESPLLIAKTNDFIMLSSEPSGFLNMTKSYYLVRDKSYGYAGVDGSFKIYGKYKELDLFAVNTTDLILPSEYETWMLKEINDQRNLKVLIDPITQTNRCNNTNLELNIPFISKSKYLYIIACGSSYYAGLIASNYFRYTKAFEFVNVFDAGEFNKAHLEAIENPERDLLVVIISQSGETRDLNIATTIIREYSSNRKNKLEPNSLLINSDPIDKILSESKIDSEIKEPDEIKIIGIINVVGSLLSRRTISNIYTNCGRENAVASTKSCTSQILACLFLAIYKSELNGKLNSQLKNKFFTDLNSLENDIQNIIDLKTQTQIKLIASNILNKLSDRKTMFLLGKDELYGCALEGALKIKEIAYIHAEGFNLSALKHGPYALIQKDTPIILIYKERDHFVKSIVEETKTRGAYVIEISPNCDSDENSIQIPNNKTTFVGLLSVIVLQLLSYNLSILQNINPDQPRNLAKVVTVD